MKSGTLEILKGLLYVSLTISLLTALGSLGISMYIGFFGEFKFDQSNLSFLFPIENKTAAISLFLFSFGLYIAISLIVLLMLKIVHSFEKGSLFTKYQIAGFNLVGQLIIWLTILQSLAEFILKMIFKSRIEFKFEVSGFWLFIALGAFFIVLSKVFQKAKMLKEENELTV